MTKLHNCEYLCSKCGIEIMKPMHLFSMLCKKCGKSVRLELLKSKLDAIKMELETI